MSLLHSIHLRPGGAWITVLVSIILTVNCSAPVKRPVGPARDYQDAKDLFKQGKFDRASDYAEGLATASPANAYTDRARTLRIVIFSGWVKAYKELAEAYAQGFKATKNPRFKAEFERLRHDSLLYGGTAALNLGDTAHRIMADGKLPKEVTLEAPYPEAEGPVTITQLARVQEGGWIESDDQEAAAVAARQKGIDDTLAQFVGADRAKARNALTAGAVKISGVDFGLFLSKQLLEGSSIFDPWHSGNPGKLRELANEADEAVKATLALLKEAPDKKKEQEAKVLAAKVKFALKNI